MICSRFDPGARCSADPCEVSSAPDECKKNPDLQCVSYYCTKPVSYLGTRLTAGPCTAIYVNVKTMKVDEGCSPDACKYVTSF